MSRLIGQLILAIFLLVLVDGMAQADANPLLYVYRGAGCTGLAALSQTQAMLNRKVDGVIDFVQYDTTADSLNSQTYSLGCWEGQGYKFAEAIPLAFTSGGSLSDVAMGKLDNYYKSVGTNLVSYGFADATIRLGHEMNLTGAGSYPWAGNSSGYIAAYQHVYNILKGTAGSNFTIIFNPSLGADPSSYFPGTDVADEVSWDDYANTYESYGTTGEPGLYNADQNNSWGGSSIGGYYGSLPHSIPEFGVGSRSDGHGACPGTGTYDCDDGYFLAQSLAYFNSIGVIWFGYWDYNAGDYNSEISGSQPGVGMSERPNEATFFIKNFGSGNMTKILTQYAASFTAQTVPTVNCTDSSGKVACHFVVFQNAPSHYEAVIWAGSSHPGLTVTWTGTITSANLYNPTVGTAIIQKLGTANSVTFDMEAGGTRIVSIAQPT